MPSERQIAEIESVFSALGDGTRLKILFALAAAGELCVSDLALVVGMNLSAISAQLRLLRGLGVVSRRHEGKMVFYFMRGTGFAQLARLALRQVTRREPRNVADGAKGT